MVYGYIVALLPVKTMGAKVLGPMSLDELVLLALKELNERISRAFEWLS